MIATSQSYIRTISRLFRPIAASLLLTSCALVEYHPISTISHIDTQKGYRLQNAIKEGTQNSNDDMFMAVLFSGGGTRAAALGYGVLEALYQQPITSGTPLGDKTDIVYGVSGGSVLAAYYALHGKDTIPAFEKRFLKQNFQQQFTKKVFSLANLPRLTAPQFGRGDLLQEQFENTLFKQTTFADLENRRKGPFAVLSATDMSLGTRINFTQEYFDAMCLNLSELPIARAVAASSAVPLVFAPITLNNYGGHCGYTLPRPLAKAVDHEHEKENENADNTKQSKRLEENTRLEFAHNLKDYENSQQRPYIHLLDGGLTDNLGLRSLLDTTQIYPSNMLYDQFTSGKINKVIVISVNAQNKTTSQIDKSANIPGFSDVVNAIINIPIDQYSQESLRQFREFADKWNTDSELGQTRKPVQLYFISLNLRDLPESQLRKNVLNIPTSFYLPATDINDLKEAARVLLNQSSEYKRLLKDLSVRPNTKQTTNHPVWFVGEGPIKPEKSEDNEEYGNIQTGLTIPQSSNTK